MEQDDRLEQSLRGGTKRENLGPQLDYLHIAGVEGIEERWCCPSHCISDVEQDDRLEQSLRGGTKKENLGPQLDYLHIAGAEGIEERWCCPSYCISDVEQDDRLEQSLRSSTKRENVGPQLDYLHIAGVEGMVEARDLAGSYSECVDKVPRKGPVVVPAIRVFQIPCSEIYGARSTAPFEECYSRYRFRIVEQEERRGGGGEGLPVRKW